LEASKAAALYVNIGAALVDCADAEAAGRTIHNNPAIAGHTFGLPRNIMASAMTALQ
jgi:hypothetical protein